MIPMCLLQPIAVNVRLHPSFYRNHQILTNTGDLLWWLLILNNAKGKTVIGNSFLIDIGIIDDAIIAKDVLNDLRIKATVWQETNLSSIG